MSSYQIQKSIFIIGNPSIRVQERYYQEFFNQKNTLESRSERLVFKFDYQRFLYAFVLGIKQNAKTPLKGHTEVSFKWEVIEHKKDLADKILGLCILNEYEGEPKKLKDDYLNSLETDDKDNTLAQNLRLAIEEYANTGFGILFDKKMANPAYMDDASLICLDIIQSGIN